MGDKEDKEERMQSYRVCDNKEKQKSTTRRKTRRYDTEGLVRFTVQVSW